LDEGAGVTAAQLVGQCRRHGFAVVYDPATGPRLVRQRDGAVLPEHLLESLKAGRLKVIEWFAASGPKAADPGVCPECRAVVDPDLCGEVCPQVGDRDGVGRCPYKGRATDGDSPPP
jgi:hypothetical protein